MIYRIDFTPRAEKQLQKLPKNIQERIGEKIAELSSDPRPAGVKKLESDPSYRIRVGSYRILYEIKDDILLVTVVRVGHRKDVYK